jgi:hypothetical protein
MNFTEKNRGEKIVFKFSPGNETTNFLTRIVDLTNVAIEVVLDFSDMPKLETYEAGTIKGCCSVIEAAMGHYEVVNYNRVVGEVLKIFDIKR